MDPESPYTILIVDDEAAVCRALTRLLRKPDRRILAAANGPQAIEALNRQAFDLIISDYNIPGMDGVELMTHARRHSPDTLRIMLSAHSDRQLLLDAVNRGSVYQFVTKPWDDDQLCDVVDEALAASDAVRSQRQARTQLEKASMETVMALAEAIELKDPYTKGHCSRVRDFSLMLADRIGLPEELRPHLVFGSLLHDCGKIGIQEAILLSMVPFDDKNRAIMQAHPVLGFQLTNKIDYLKTASLFIRQHHERWDGKGYPDGLRGEAIHVCSRIISIADAFDAMTTDRPYQEGMPAARAVDILQANRGTQFDPDLVDAFVDGLQNRAGVCLSAGDDSGTMAAAPKLLFVDDEINVLKSLKRCLAGEGYQIETALSGRTALDMLADYSADIIISDQRMPGMDGVEFLKRSSTIRPNAVRIMLSGHAGIYTDLETINDAGLYKLMAKPWDADDLKHSLKSALEWRQMVWAHDWRLN